MQQTMTESHISSILDINSLPDSYYLTACQQYLSSSSKSLLEEILWLCNDSESYSIPIDLMRFIHYNPVLGNLIFLYPDRMLFYLNSSIMSLRDSAIEFYLHNRVDKSDQLKSNIKIHARFTHFPTIPNLIKGSINDIKSSDVGRLILLTGTIIRVGSIKLHEISREYLCMKCNHHYYLFVVFCLCAVAVVVVIVWLIFLV